MDVTFTNVLEGARQYFQGLPAATSSSAGPTYTTSTSENSHGSHRSNNGGPDHHHQASADGSTTPSSSAAYWPPQPQQEAIRPPTREQTPVQRPSSHHSDTSRPPSHHSQMAHYQQQQQQYPQSYQFPRPHYQQQQQSPYQPSSPQQPRPPSSRQEHNNMTTSTSSASSVPSQSYHQLQNSTQPSSHQGYQNYQQQQQQQQQPRSYYPPPPQSQVKPQIPTSNNSTYKGAPSQPNSSETVYYKHLYSPHPPNNNQHNQMQQYNSKSTYNNNQQDNNNKQDQHQQVIVNQQQAATSQSYRNTHNLPPIAALSSLNYHSNRTSNDGRNVNKSSGQMQQQIPAKNSAVAYPHQYQQPPRQNYYPATTTTQSYSQVIMTTSNSTTSSSSGSYTIPIQNSGSHNQSSSEPNVHQQQHHQQQQQQHYYHQGNKLIQDQSTSVRTNNTVSSVSVNHQQSTSAVTVPLTKQKRESPLDLSVKTVRTPADSTLDDADQDRKFYNNNNNNNNRTSISNSSIASHNYPTYDVYANSFQRNLSSNNRPPPAQIQQQQQQQNVTAPKVEFHPNFNVPSLNHSDLNYKRNNNNSVPEKVQIGGNHQQRSPYKGGVYHPPINSNTLNRPPHHSIPYQQQQTQPHPPPKRLVETLPRMDFPPPGHGHKTSALYPVPTHEMQKKRPADTAPSSIIPNKQSKVDTWRMSMDQQIEQRLSAYKQQQQQQKHVSSSPNGNKSMMVNGGYPNTEERYKDMYNAYQRQQYHSQSYGTNHTNQYSHPQNSQQNNNHNQTYVPSAVAHQFPGYSANSVAQQSHHPLHRVNSNSSLNSGKSGNVGGADKRVLSLLRNSLEIKGAKEAQKKLEQEQLKCNYDNLKYSRLDIQHPSTDVTAPLQPKPGFVNRNNVSPFTPTNFPDANSSIYKLHFPKAVDSVNFESERSKYLSNSVERVQLLDDGQTILNATNPNGDLDGLAAFLAARIRTKAELKQVGPTQNNNQHNLVSVIENQLKTPMKQDNYEGTSPLGATTTTGTPPKLLKEQRHALAPRRRLFSRSEEECGNFGIVPPRDKSGLRSSSETSVFDFPDTDSEGEMPVLERQTLEDMRRDRKTTTIKVADYKPESPIRPMSPGDDLFAQACDKIMEQLKSGSGKKRGRRKKFEADVLAKLETVTKERPLDSVESIVKKEDEVVTIDKISESVDGATVVSNNNKTDDDDSDVPLIQCKNKDSARSPIKIEEPQMSNEKTDPVNGNESESPNVKVVTDVINTRPAKKPAFGDGSHFCPGWEEEVYKYKKSLRMPPSLIQVTRPPQYHRLSTSLPDLDPCPNSPTPSSLLDVSEFAKAKSKIKTEVIDSDDNESNCSFNLFKKVNYDSEGSSSIKSLPNTNRENSSILDKLLERYGGRTRRKHKRKDDDRPKIIPKSDKEVELLATPKLAGDDKPEEDKSDGVVLGFRKKTIDSFKDVFLNNVSEIHSRTRKQTRILKQRVTIKEVFGEDRPASAPPVTCVDHIKIKEEIVDDESDNYSLSSLIRKDDDSDRASTKQVLKNKLLNRGKKESSNLLKTLVDRKIKTELYEIEDIENIIKRDPDSKSETPSIDGDEGGVSGKKQRNKLRRKFSSGFDYIRKKKKQVKKDNAENDSGGVVNKAKKRGPVSTKANPGSVQDIQKEIKGWVLNKGIGETHLHRSARLGYTDITAYCLEKMECSPSPKDNAGYTPLHEASARGHLSIAKMLLMYGANVSESARGGIRPLHEAVENGYVEIVRLLLSYGADPKLATYSGMTPLALAADDLTAKLLENHINDVSGNPGPSWEFLGPASCFDVKEMGYNILSEIPDEDHTSEEEDLDFEISDSLLPNLYTLRGEPVSDRWVLLQDLSSLLRIKSRDALLRQICPSTSSSSSTAAYKTVLRELKMSDFLEQAHCCQFLNIGEKINTRASKIALVKYTDKVRELLNVEKVNISVR